MKPAFTILLALGVSLAARTACAATAGAVTTVQPFVTALAPAGVPGGLLTGAVLSGAELDDEVLPSLWLVGTFAWTVNADRTISDARTSLYQYEAGFELVRRTPADEHWRLTPYAGAGLGARTYSFASSPLVGYTGLDAYGELGEALTRGGIGARLAVRDDIARQPDGGAASNDVAISAAMVVGLAAH